MAGGRASRASTKSKGTASSAASAPSLLSREDALQSLQQAFETLKTLPQGQGDLDSSRALCQPRVMHHASSEVRLWAAKCFAEVLRVFVPSPPFEPERFRPILELFMEQLAALNPSTATYTHGFGLLERLAEIRGFMLVFDCSPSDVEPLITSLAAACIAAAKASRQAAGIGGTEDAQRRLDAMLSRLLADVLLEADEIPEAVLEKLLEEMIEKKSAGAAMVRQVLTRLANHRAAIQVNDFVNKSLFFEASPDKPQELSQERLEGLLQATYELYCIEPALVARVLQNLNADLQRANPNRRRAITALVAQLLAHREPSGQVLSCMTWASSGLVDRFQDRLADADEGVRMTALEGASAVLQSVVIEGRGHEEAKTGAEGIDKLEGIRKKVADRCLDPNDQIRLRTVEICMQLASSDAGLVFMLPILPEVSKRILDKKPRIREACAQACAQLYAKHALPHWLSGQGQAAQRLSWIPALLCEAFSVFSSARLGYVAQIEELIEQHILGCGTGLPADQRARALIGLCSSVCTQSQQGLDGLSMLLSKKRDANKALRRFVRARMTNAAPLGEVQGSRCSNLMPLESTENEAIQATDGEKPIAGDSFRNLFENLAKWSPTHEDKYARPESLGLHLRSLDAVRDKTLWAHLDHLLDPNIQDSTGEMREQVRELDRLLRVHKLGETAPLIRRALVSTWLLPDQVAALLDIWTGQATQADGKEVSTPASDISDIMMAARATVAFLPKYFAGAFSFSPFLGELVKLLKECGPEDAQTILQALSRIHKQMLQMQQELPASCLEGMSGVSLPVPVGKASEAAFAELLLETLHVISQPGQSSASSARKCARLLLMLPDDSRASVTRQLLLWADSYLSGRRGDASNQSEGVANSEGTGDAAEVLSWRTIAFHLAAAILETPGACLDIDYDWKPWLQEAQSMLRPNTGAGELSLPSLQCLQCAAAELLAAGGTASQVATLLQGPWLSMQGSEPLVLLSDATATAGGPALLDDRAVYLVCAALRSLRFGRLELSTQLLAQLSERCGDFMEGRPVGDVEKLLQMLQKFQKHSKLKIADRLRLCTTLPSIFCFATQKKHRDAGQRILQAWLRAAQQGAQPGLLDFSVACFVHFLSRLQIFKREAAASVSAFPESSKVSTFFCEALLRCNPEGAELLGTALRVCDRVRYFVDREAEDGSSSVKIAAGVLRYVVEKHCPELGLQAASLLQGAARGSMPAQLFAIDPATERLLNAAALKDSQQEQESQIPETPALQDAGQDAVASPERIKEIDVQSSALVQDVLTTPQRRPSLLKRGAGSSPQTPSPSSQKRSLTGEAVSAALAAQSAKKTKKQRVPC